MLVRLPLPFAGTGEPVGLIRRSDTQPSAVGRAFIEAVREVARSRMAAVSGKEAGKGAGKAVGKTARKGAPGEVPLD